MRVLVAGWFSFEQMGATAGDLLARDTATGWLRAAGIPFEVALAPPFSEIEQWPFLNPEEYSHLLFICGPCGDGPPVDALLDRFRGAIRLGLNLSMLDPLDAWNPFDHLWERDSSAASRPDLVFVSEGRRVPVVGLVLVHPQGEYGVRGRHEAIHEAIHRLVDAHEMATIPIDTRLDLNRTGLRTAAEVESAISRMDVVVTTRLHGTVLALKNGVPALVVDPIAGGAKVARQARTLGWPVFFTPETVTEDGLCRAFRYCLTEPARREALACRARAMDLLSPIRDELIGALVSGRPRRP